METPNSDNWLVRQTDKKIEVDLEKIGEVVRERNGLKDDLIMAIGFLKCYGEDLCGLHHQGRLNSEGETLYTDLKAFLAELENKTLTEK